MLDVTFANNGRTRRSRGWSASTCCRAPPRLCCCSWRVLQRRQRRVPGRLDPGHGRRRKGEPSQADAPSFTSVPLGAHFHQRGRRFVPAEGRSIRKVRVDNDASGSASSKTPKRAGAALAGSRAKRASRRAHLGPRGVSSTGPITQRATGTVDRSRACAAGLHPAARSVRHGELAAAPAAFAAKARRPRARLPSHASPPMRISVGGTLTITGRTFKRKRTAKRSSSGRQRPFGVRQAAPRQREQLW